MAGHLNFVHTHVHSIFSIGDGNLRFPSLFKEIKKMGMDEIIITDHGNISHLPQALKEAKKAGVKYAPGCEVYVTPGQLDDKDDDRVYHLNIVPRTQEGYHNFVDIISTAGMNKNNYRKSSKQYERTDMHELKKKGKGIIGYSACLGGHIPKLLEEKRFTEAVDVALEYDKIFDKFYLELQAHHHPKQVILNEQLKKLSEETGIEMIITTDAHFLKKEDKKYHDILVQIAYKQPYDFETIYIQTPEEIKAYCEQYDIPLSAMENTKKLFDSIQSIDFIPKDTNFFLPEYDCPDGYTPDDYLHKVSKEGLVNKLKVKNIMHPDKYLKQIDYELNQVIAPKGFSSYFLILKYIVDECRRRKILIGPGRGCFLPDSKVKLENNSLKDIQDINKGDKVVTHLGNIKEVTDTMQYDVSEEMYEIKANGFDTIKCTNNHEIYALKTESCKNDIYKQSHCTVKCERYEKNCSFKKEQKLGWVRADELSKGDFLSVPRVSFKNKTIHEIDLALSDTNLVYDDNKVWYNNSISKYETRKVNRFIKIDANFAELSGYYIGNGCSCKDSGISISLNNINNDTNIERVVELYNLVFGVTPTFYYNKRKTVVNINLRHKPLSSLFKQLFGDKALNKIIPDMLLVNNKEMLKGLLQGLYRTDGYIPNGNENKLTYSTINENLAFQIQAVLSHFDIYGSINKFKKRKTNWNPEIKVIVSGKQLKDVINILPEMILKQQSFWRNDFIKTDDYFFCPIKSINKFDYTGKVYDISVDKDTSYTINGFAVHNSAAGSTIGYACGITNIDPIKNNFVFERFLTRKRDEMPDIDSDVSKVRRAEVIDLIADKFKRDRVFQLMTFTYLGFKSGVKAIMRALDESEGDHPFEEVNKLTKKLPGDINQIPITLELYKDIIYNDPDKWLIELGDKTMNDVKAQWDRITDFFSKYPKVQDLLEGVSGAITATGLHAGAVIVAGEPLKSHVPITKGSDTAVLPVVAYDMDGATDFNLLKVDLLGLRTLSTMEEFMDLTGLGFDWFDSEDFDDEETYKTIANGYTSDGFQICTNSAKNLLRTFKIDDFNDFSAFVACNRPGPLSKDKTTGKSMVDLYIEAKETGKLNKLYDPIDGVLEDTQGVMIYQEQLMQIGQILAGYDLGGADIRIRKVLGKKKLEMIPEIEAEFLYGKQYDSDDKKVIDSPSKFCQGVNSRGYDVKKSKHIFDIMKEFAKYCFNRSHSGAYAALGYKSMWAKTHYPVEWTLACLKTHDKDELARESMIDARKLGIVILPPDINKSDSFFKIEGTPSGEKQLRFGLSSIKGVGTNAVIIIEHVRRTMGDFVSLQDFYDKVHSLGKQDLLALGCKTNAVNKRVEKFLIEAGCFDFYNTNRYELLNEYNFTVYKGKQDNVDKLSSSQFTKKVKLQQELDLLGMYVSEHPLDKFPYENFELKNTGDMIETSGVIQDAEVKMAKNKKEYAKLIVEDKDGRKIPCMLFGGTFNRYKQKILNDDGTTKKNEVVVIDGEVNKLYNNINITKLRSVVRKRKPTAKASDFIPPVVDVD